MSTDNVNTDGVEAMDNTSTEDSAPDWKTIARSRTSEVKAKDEKIAAKDEKIAAIEAELASLKKEKEESKQKELEKQGEYKELAEQRQAENEQLQSNFENKINGMKQHMINREIKAALKEAGAEYPEQLLDSFIREHKPDATLNDDGTIDLDLSESIKSYVEKYPKSFASVETQDKKEENNYSALNGGINNNPINQTNNSDPLDRVVASVVGS